MPEVDEMLSDLNVLRTEGSAHGLLRFARIRRGTLKAMHSAYQHSHREVAYHLRLLQEQLAGLQKQLENTRGRLPMLQERLGESHDQVIQSAEALYAADEAIERLCSLIRRAGLPLESMDKADLELMDSGSDFKVT
jgi:chromosome segregation ATPase